MVQLTDHQLDRYSRQLVVSQVGLSGQACLIRKNVLIVGAGGLGGPIAQYLAGAGVGRIRLVDPDLVELSNLPRQTSFIEEDIGAYKCERLAAKLSLMNDEVAVEHYISTFDVKNSSKLMSDMDLVIDATDSSKSRLDIDLATFECGLPWIMGAAAKTAGQWAAFDPSRKFGCYHCWQHETQDIGCSQLGILGPVVGIISMQEAILAIKFLLGERMPWGTLYYYDAWNLDFTSIQVSKLGDCEVCGLRI